MSYAEQGEPAMTLAAIMEGRHSSPANLDRPRERPAPSITNLNMTTTLPAANVQDTEHSTAPVATGY